MVHCKSDVAAATDQILVGSNVKFERIRRITGYLVGTLDRFNDGKAAEERDRVKHCSMDNWKSPFVLRGDEGGNGANPFPLFFFRTGLPSGSRAADMKNAVIPCRPPCSESGTLCSRGKDIRPPFFASCTPFSRSFSPFPGNELLPGKRRRHIL